ncbi:MAG: hypothetical protein Q4C64_02330 [Erysipelotrichia bacterium]|nr:hypothetical protein [Erysipelotrichia bacterium]
MTIDIKVVENNTTINVSSNNTDKINTSGSDNTQLVADVNDNNSINAELNVNSLNLDADIGEVQVTSETINDYETLLNRPKINGIVLSGNKTSSDLELADKSHNHDERYYTETEVNTLLTGKVDVEEGKGLSTNDFTSAEKSKLENLSNYELPIASETELGGIKVGEGLTITNGVLSASGGGEAESVQWNNVLNKPTTFTPSSHTHTKTEITDFPTLSTVATSGSYNDLTDKPTIPTVDSALSATSVNPVQNKAVKTALDGKADSSHNHDERYYTETEIDSKLSEKANVEHTHTKSDITDFAHNHDERYYTESEIDEKIPTKTSQLINDSGFLTSTPSWTLAWSGQCYGGGTTISCTIPTTAKSVCMFWKIQDYWSCLTMYRGATGKMIVSDESYYAGGQISYNGETMTYTHTGQTNNNCYLGEVWYR